MKGPRANAGLAVVTGASSGIGRELAWLCARDGHDLIIAARGAEIHDIARQLRTSGSFVEVAQVDLATRDGLEQLAMVIDDRAVDILCANAGLGHGGAFLDLELDVHRAAIDVNVGGTVELVHRVGRRMRDRGRGRILITGSIAGYVPGSNNAIYNATKAFVNSLSVAVADELSPCGVTVTCLMPGPTRTRFFEKAGMADALLAHAPNMSDPATVAEAGYRAMLAGEVSVTPGMTNRIGVLVAGVMPQALLARVHRTMARRGGAGG